MDAVRGIDAARRATVQVYDRGAQTGKEHRGQGLLLDLGGQRIVVLTCHHVIAPVTKENLYIRIRQSNDQLSDPIPAQYDEQRSQPERDAVVLHVDRALVSTRPRPLLHALNPKTYAGSLAATGLTYMEPESFNAHVVATTRLEISVETPGDWPDPPTLYVLPVAYRLADPTDAREGISGGVVLCEDGVLGLVHFSRGAAAAQEREAYLVPLSVWAAGLPELAKLIEPLIDADLRGTATIKRPGALEIGLDKDVTIEGYQRDLYIEREAEARAHLALQQHGGVIIIGRPRSGKTRLAWRLLHERPEALVVIPNSSEPPVAFESWGLTGEDVVLFFDDLHEPAMSMSSRPLDWRRRLKEATGRPCLLICTTRDGKDWERIQDNQMRLLRVLGRDTRIFTSQVVENDEVKGEDLSRAQGWELAQALGLSSEKFDRRFDGTPGSITLDLDDMKRRYKRLREESLGTVPMSRLLNSAKLLYVAHQPRRRGSLLRTVAEQIRGEGRIGPDTWDALKRRTQEEGFGQFDSNDEFQTYRPYLEECVEYEPSAEETEALLPILINAEDYDGLLYLGDTLREERRLSPAERAFRVSIDGGNKTAYVDLGRVLAEQPGRETEAEQAYRQAIDAGIDAGIEGAYNGLGLLLAEQPGREAEAEQAYRQAIDEGADITYLNLGTLLAQQPGREAEAEQAYREAINRSRGETLAKFWYLALGDFLAKQPGREADAEEAYLAAIGGYAPTYLQLGKFLSKQPGREADAEEVFRIVIDTTDITDEKKVQMAVGFEALDEIYHNLGLLLAQQPGREAEAEQAYREAINLGVEEAYFDLGALLAWQPGREAAAEQAYRKAIDAGMIQAQTLLGLLLSEQSGREAEAEQAYRKAIDAGVDLAYFYLGTLLSKQPGREAEAEQAYRKAIDLGVEEAYFNLGVLLVQQPGHEAEAEQAYRKAIELGDEEAYNGLGYLLSEQPGREAEAEQAYRQAIELSVEEAYFNLGVLLAQQPGREAEAEQAYRKAIELGDEEAYNGLGYLLAQQPEREAEAEQAYRKAIDAGMIQAQTLLGLLLSEQPGREAEAEQAYRKAIDLGDEEAYINLGNLLSHQPGREAEAEKAYHQASVHKKNH